jgi:glyoxylase-like metal-dependent hydrolase (beta-lactamase superfamily II)
MVASPVRLTLPLPFALRTANAWLFPGEQPALVDCGIGTPEGQAALMAGLAAAGVAPGDLRLFVTHGHIDHAGNAAALAKQGAPLHAPAEERPYIETFRRDAGRRADAFARALERHGAPPPAVAAARERAAEMDSWMHDAPIAAPLRDGERLVLGGTDVTAHLTPGHTPGSTVFLTAGNELLSGDTLLEHITSNAIELLDRDKGRYSQYLRTLDGLHRFVGCEVLPGHHEPFRLTTTLLEGHLEKHRRRGRKVLDALDSPHTAWDLLPRVLPHLAHDQIFLGMCEMVGHLHDLESQGLVQMTDHDGVRRFERVAGRTRPNGS